MEHKNKITFLVLIIAVLLLWFLGRYFHIDSDRIQNFLEEFPVIYAGIIFIILYVLITFFIWLSKDIFRLVSAVLFGAYISTLFIWIAEIINACILFSLSRYLGRGFVEDAFKTPKFKNLDERLTRTNFFWLLMFRLVPLVPFRFLDLAIGLTNISFKKYLIAVVLGSPIRIFWVQYILAGVGQGIFSKPYALIEYLMANKALFSLSFVYLAMVILVAFKIKKEEAK
jgi:uncharacterized membrane protein YdjX (TVP38/TMEM64 family)